jgi:hypothetical protein
VDDAPQHEIGEGDGSPTCRPGATVRDGHGQTKFKTNSNEFK